MPPAIVAERGICAMSSHSQDYHVVSASTSEQLLQPNSVLPNHNALTTSPSQQTNNNSNRFASPKEIASDMLPQEDLGGESDLKDKFDGKESTSTVTDLFPFLNDKSDGDGFVDSTSQLPRDSAQTMKLDAEERKNLGPFCLIGEHNGDCDVLCELDRKIAEKSVSSTNKSALDFETLSKDQEFHETSHRRFTFHQNGLNGKTLPNKLHFPLRSNSVRVSSSPRFSPASILHQLDEQHCEMPTKLSIASSHGRASLSAPASPKSAQFSAALQNGETEPSVVTSDDPKAAVEGDGKGELSVGEEIHPLHSITNEDINHRSPAFHGVRNGDLSSDEDPVPQQQQQHLEQTEQITSVSLHFDGSSADVNMLPLASDHCKILESLCVPLTLEQAIIDGAFRSAMTSVAGDDDDQLTPEEKMLLENVQQFSEEQKSLSCSRQAELYDCNVLASAALTPTFSGHYGCAGHEVRHNLYADSNTAACSADGDLNINVCSPATSIPSTSQDEHLLVPLLPTPPTSTKSENTMDGSEAYAPTTAVAPEMPSAVYSSEMMAIDGTDDEASLASSVGIVADKLLSQVQQEETAPPPELADMAEDHADEESDLISNSIMPFLISTVEKNEEISFLNPPLALDAESAVFSQESDVMAGMEFASTDAIGSNPNDQLSLLTSDANVNDDEELLSLASVSISAPSDSSVASSDLSRRNSSFSRCASPISAFERISNEAALSRKYGFRFDKDAFVTLPRLDDDLARAQAEATASVRAERLEAVLAKARDQRRRVEQLKRRLALLHSQQLLYHGEDQLHQLMRRVNQEFLRVLPPMTMGDVNSLMSDPNFDEKLARLMQSSDSSLRLNCLSRAALSASSASLIKAIQRYGSSAGRPFPLDLMPKGPHFIVPPVDGAKRQSAGQSQELPSLERLFDLTKKDADKVRQNVNPMIAVYRHYLKNVLDPDATDCSSSEDEDDDDCENDENRSTEKNKKRTSSGLNRIAIKTDSAKASTSSENECTANARFNSNQSTLLRRRAKLGSRWDWLQAEINTLDVKMKQAAYFQDQLRVGRTAIPFVSGPNVPDEFLDVDGTEKTLDAEVRLRLEAETETCARVRGLSSRWPKRPLVRPRISTLCRENVHFIPRPISDYCECSPVAQLCVVCVPSMEKAKQAKANAGLDHQYFPVPLAPLKQPKAKKSSLPKELPAALSRKRKFSLSDVTDADSKSSARGFLSQSPKRRRTANHADLSPILRPHAKDEQSKHKQLAATLHRIAGSGKKKDHRKSAAGIGASPRGSRAVSPASPRSVEHSHTHGAASQQVFSPKPIASGLSGRRQTTPSADYDINNIVVDPSVGAVTRVALLPYKEIKTPGWSTVDAAEDEQRTSALNLEEVEGEEPLEDLSDDAFLKRHHAREMEERKRFESYKAYVKSAMASRRPSNASAFPYHHSVASTSAASQLSSTSADAHASNASLVRSSGAQSPSPKGHSSGRTNASACSSAADDRQSGVTGHMTSSFSQRQFPLDQAEYEALMEEQRIAEAEQKAVEENFKRF